MQTRFAKMLLLGVMLTAPLLAQSKHAATKHSNLDVAVTYSARMSNIVSSDSFVLSGGSIQVHGQFWRGLGVVGDISGDHVSKMGHSTVGLDMVSSTFGPRYTWRLANQRYSLYGQMLAGEANGFNSVFPHRTGWTSDEFGIALKGGGGVNVKLTNRTSLRLFEANWVHTQFPNSTSNVQNSLQLGAGIIIKIP